MQVSSSLSVSGMVLDFPVYPAMVFISSLLSVNQLDLTILSFIAQKIISWRKVTILYTSKISNANEEAQSLHTKP